MSAFLSAQVRLPVSLIKIPANVVGLLLRAGFGVLNSQLTRKINALDKNTKSYTPNEARVPTQSIYAIYYQLI